MPSSLAKAGDNPDVFYSYRLLRNTADVIVNSDLSPSKPTITNGLLNRTLFICLPIYCTITLASDNWGPVALEQQVI
jgi:hypothetical protein